MPKQPASPRSNPPGASLQIQPGSATVLQGDCLDWIPRLRDDSVDVVVTSPPYWGQRESLGVGTEEDPREYLVFLESVFAPCCRS